MDTYTRFLEEEDMGLYTPDDVMKIVNSRISPNNMTAREAYAFLEDLIYQLEVVKVGIETDLTMSGGWADDE